MNYQIAGSLADSDSLCSRSLRWHEGLTVLAKQTFMALGGAWFLLASVYCQIVLEHNIHNRPLPEDQFRYLPTAELVKGALLGYSSVGADFLWLKFVQVIGGEQARYEEEYRWMHHALDVITTLDPHFIEAYDLGSIALAELAGQAELGNALLQKGISANPHAWRLHFVLGFNYFFHQRQYDLAANAMAQAARLPGVPSYVPQLAARLYVQAQDPQAAILFLDSMLGDSPTQELRRSLEYRKQEVLVERDILAIEQAITKYQQRYSHTPRSLNQLVEHGFLSALPSEPFGGMYQLDPTTGDVNSTTHRKRLKLFQPSKV